MKGLDGNLGQLNLVLVNVADRWMQNHTDLLVCERLIDKFKELAKEAETLNCGQPELKIFRHRVLAHYLQELVPVAVRYLNGSNNAQANACAFERIAVLAGQHL